LYLTFHQFRCQRSAWFGESTQRPRGIDQNRIVIVAQCAPQVACESRGFLGGVNAIKINEPVKGEETADLLICIAACHD
jgi:hypothetical protein